MSKGCVCFHRTNGAAKGSTSKGFSGFPGEFRDRPTYRGSVWKPRGSGGDTQSSKSPQSRGGTSRGSKELRSGHAACKHDQRNNDNNTNNNSNNDNNNNENGNNNNDNDKI